MRRSSGRDSTEVLDNGSNFWATGHTATRAKTAELAHKAGTAMLSIADLCILDHTHFNHLLDPHHVRRLALLTTFAPFERTSFDPVPSV